MLPSVGGGTYGFSLFSGCFFFDGFFLSSYEPGLALGLGREGSWRGSLGGFGEGGEGLDHDPLAPRETIHDLSRPPESESTRGVSGGGGSGLEVLKKTHSLLELVGVGLLHEDKLLELAQIPC